MALIDVVKFDAPSDDVLVWKFPSEDLRLGTQLIVHETQEAVFVKGGEALDVFTAGTHTLTTENIPLLNKLINLPFGGKTPFTAEIWYVSRTTKRDLKWGTKAPIPVLDPVYNFPVSVRAFGRYGIRVVGSRSLLLQLVGTRQLFTAAEVDEYFVGEIVQKLSDTLAKSFAAGSMSIFQANAKLTELSEHAAKEIASEFARFGVDVVNFNIERISIPDEETKKFQDVLGKRMEAEQLGKAEVTDSYRTLKSFEVLQKAAENPGGAAGAMMAGGLGLGAAFGAAVPLGKEMGDRVRPPADSAARLLELKKLLDSGLITEEEFTEAKRKVLDSI